MFIKVFLAAVVVLALLGCIGANQRENKRLAAGIALVALILLTVVMVSGSSKKEDKPTAVAPESGEITVDQNQWGTITVTDRETGITREYQGCIHISGSYPYETYEFMGLCVNMDAAITIGEWRRECTSCITKMKKNIGNKKKQRRRIQTMNNFILLYGEALDYPQQVSVDKRGKAYYKFNAAVERESGIIDILPIVVEEDTPAYNVLADIDEIGEIVGTQLLITGEIRTRNIKDKLDVSVRALSIKEDNDYKGITNQVIVTGYICKEVPIRTTPRGLLIADLVLAVNREDDSKLSDYIPSIMWNGTATRAKEKLRVGDCIEAIGRLQSREYIKDLGDGEKEPRTCLELSVNKYELQKISEVSA